MDFKKLFPHLLAIIVFLVIGIGYLAPAINGKVIKQGDIQQYSGASKEIQDYRDKEGKGPMWTNSMFGGMPSYQISWIQPNNWAQYLRKLTIIKHPLDMLFLGMLCSYILLLVMGVSPYIAIIGAVAYGLSTYNIIILEAGHNTKLYAINYAPLVLAGLVLLFKQKWLYGFALSAVALALQLQANHFQITYYLMMICGMMIVAKLIESVLNKNIKNWAIAVVLFAIGSALGFGTGAGSLLLTEEYSKETIRGASELTLLPDGTSKQTKSTGLDKSYAFDWSQGWADLFTVLVPNFAGGSSSVDLGKNNVYQALKEANYGDAAKAVKSMPAYWGVLPFTSGPVYFGAIMMFLFVLGFFVSKDKTKWWYLIAFFLSLFLSMGKNLMWFNTLFFDLVPFYNKFRSVNMAMVIAQIVVPIFAILALNDIFKNYTKLEDIKKPILNSLYIVGGLLILLILYSFGVDTSSEADAQVFGTNQALIDAMHADRQHLIMLDALRSLFFVIAFVVILYYYYKGKAKINTAILIIGLLVLADLWLVGKRNLNNDNFESKSKLKTAEQTPSEADAKILQDKSYYRVFDATGNAFNSARTSYFHHSIGGYHAAKLRRFQELVDWYITKNNMEVVNMLNGKYFIFNDQTNQGQQLVQTNPDACGNAWFVKEYKIVKNADEEIKEFGKIKPKNTALIDARFSKEVEGLTINYDSSNTIVFGSYHPEKLTYTSNSKTPQLALFSEVYYNQNKGWVSYIDGKKVPHFRANYLIRALQVPAGKHQIEFKYEPQKLALASNITLFSNIGMYGVAIIALILALLHFKNNNLQTMPISEPEIKHSVKKKK